MCNTDSRTPASHRFKQKSNITVPCLYKAQNICRCFWLTRAAANLPKARGEIPKLNFQGPWERSWVACRWQNTAGNTTNRNLMLSPIKHLKFAVDNYTQKTVAHLENKEKEVKNKTKLHSPPAIKTKTPTHTQRLTGIQMLFILQFGNK